ncbi:non-ribosomal peptide synthetase [Myxococcus stipitatus DSM 14675]|uniref:Non-ribosomal peptide synthetase n=1 Tax=Myxococcus stipitatus (strain DSM 14675 / JCM 12634 / Mx s8) TaxID=1278073 RepID=L7U7M0_MYXSD|nr:non-ribosomal peptide synthetase [Myxococcus stipitatus]AGC43825.1 non-ribosomal peptide synthetase [Myxococcus stipitatus DSM 14675]
MTLSSPTSSFQPPRNRTEELLCELWSVLLEVERVGIHDDFFQLGGHSLIATQLVSRLNELFHLRFPLPTIFDAPTIAELAAAIESARGEETASQDLPLRPCTQGSSVPLSFAQERLWFMELLYPGTATYNIPVFYRITSPLDVGVLQRALDEVLLRHESLRTTFVPTDSGPVARIAPPRAFPLTVVDLSRLPADTRDEEAARIATEHASHPIDVRTGPIIQGTLLKVGAKDHRLLLVVHHIVSDGWSLGVLMRELRTLYSDFAAGQPSSLPPLPLRYADFAVWQRQWLPVQTQERLLPYWRKRLAGAPTLLALPADRPRQQVQTFKGTRRTFHIPEETALAIEALCRRERTTLFMTLLAGFCAVLHRYTGQDDVVVGSPISGRIRPEVEGLIGFFVNTLVLRNDLSGDPRFVDLLTRVREVTLGAFAHQEMPFEKLVEALQPERTLSHAQFIQVMFVLQRSPTLEAAPSAALQLAPSPEAWEVNTGTAKGDLLLYMARTPEGLRATFEYDNHLFEDARIERMAGHLQVLLEAVAADPFQRLSALPLLTPTERNVLLREWNSATTDYPRDACVHELFSRQAERTPDAIAVSYGASSITYRELDARSNRLAHHLKSLGVGPEVLVGLCVERSVDLIVSMLGILKAGGAYLPLEAAYPSERLAFMLEDARVSLLLVHAAKLQQLPPFPGPVVRVDTDQDAIARHSDLPLASTARPDNLAYVIYTSGSTGRPKGSAIVHRGIAALLFHTNFVRFTPTDRVAQASNASFDPSTFEIWGALLNGARLVGITADPAREPQELAAQIQGEAVSIMFVTTAVLHLLARQVPDAFRYVHTLVFGGEAADPLALREVLRHGPPRRLLNGYGPTECTVFSTSHAIDAPPSLGQPVPIGRPITNGPVYLLDKHSRPVPIGVPGELYVAGERLGRGYFNRPELTARTYVPDPFSTKPGARLYKTGDLGRYLPNGRIEYLGRVDLQVKIRGFRVELGEIEESLRLHPGVEDGSVVAVEVGGDRKLAAYFVARGPAPTPSVLRNWLRERLPEHMVPTSFTLLAALPLTPNGKVDRRALPSPEQPQADTSTYQAPRTFTEETLCRMWGALLAMERVGIHDNFFHLGGHSLLATQVVSRVRAELGVEVSLRTLFASPTVADLARHISRAEPSVVLARPVPPLRRVPREGAMRVSFAQERLWRFFQRAPESSAYNIPRAFRLKGRVDPKHLESAFQALIARHETLRVIYSEEDGVPVQRVQPKADFRLREVDLRGREDREEEATREMLRSALLPFDLSTGPLMHGALLRLEDEEFVLFFCMHHITADGWSMGLTSRELGRLYTAIASGVDAGLAPLAIQYPDYAAWQREWLSGEELKERLSFWKKSLAGAPTQLDIPTDRPRPATRTFNGIQRQVALGQARTQALNALCRQEQVTPFMALLSVFGIMLARRAGQDEVVIGSPIANRLRPESEPLIGMFVNGLCLRVNLRGAPAFRELLQRVREETLAGFAHQEVPIDQVVTSLGVELPANRSPVFQAMFVLQNAPTAPLEIPGVSVTPVPVDRGSVTYELTLALTETPEGFAGVLEVNTDLFKPEMAEHLHAELEALLDAVLANPDLPVGLETRASR